MILLSKSILALTLAGCSTIMMLTNCELSANNGGNVTVAHDDVMVARQEWLEAQRDSVADCIIFKAESAARVYKNVQIIADFKVRIMTGEKAMKARYQKQLEELKKKNSNLSYKLERYSESGTDNCETFKREWNDDMNRLVKALHEMTQNKK